MVNGVKKRKKIYKVKEKTYAYVLKIPLFRRILLPDFKEYELRELPNGLYDKPVYVIRYRSNNCGLMAMVRVIVHQLLVAEQRGYIPVVDMQSYSNIYHTKETLGKKNIWDMFFEQPAGLTLEDVACAKNVIVSSWAHVEKENLYSGEILNVVKKYIRFSDRINSIVDSIWLDWKKKLKKENPRILGVKLRGTDYQFLKQKKHAKQPNVKEAIDTIDKLICSWGKFDAIYLTTEDQSIFSAMKNNYGERLLYNEHIRVEHNDSWGNEKYMNRPLKFAEDYAVDIGLLVNCNSIIASDCQGTLVARWMKQDKFENTYIFDLGEY